MNLLEIQGLKTHFYLNSGILDKVFGKPEKIVHAVDGVSFAIKKGSTFGLVGESGCGKSTLGESIFGLAKPQSGKILFKDEDILAADGKGMKNFREKAQLIFQDPYASLNPRMTAGEIIAEPLEVYSKISKSAVTEKVMSLLEQVQLGTDAATKFPSEFSGGQARRIGVARAIALEPELVVADEPTSGLDISTVATVLNLMQSLQDKYGLTYLWISHNLDQIEYMCDEMAVMYLGKIVEKGKVEDIIRHRAHPYTRALMASIPSIGRKKKMLSGIRGELPSPINLPKGCSFAARCDSASKRCFEYEPIIQEVGINHYVACHLYDK